MGKVSSGEPPSGSSSDLLSIMATRQQSVPATSSSVNWIGGVKLSVWLAMIVLTGSLFWNNILMGVDAAKGKQRATRAPPLTAVPVKFHEDYRPIQWCVNGQDEPEFRQYPWNEFAPIIQRSYYENFKFNERYTYHVSLWPIKINTSPGYTPPGQGGALFQRAHFVFTIKLRRLFEKGIYVKQLNSTLIEGLLVQANFAPFDVGLPVGQFMHPKWFNCQDCEKPVGIPIACRRRTYMHIVHPTIMAYHHKMKIPSEEKYRRQTFCYNQYTPSLCILTGFENTDPPPDKTAFTDLWKWGDALKDYVSQPIPALSKDRCTPGVKDECESLFNSWFDRSCCGSEKDSDDNCNITATIDALGAAGTAGGKAPEFPTDDLCPNKGKDPAQNVSKTPMLQSEDWPLFTCKPFEVSVCRPIGHPKIPRWESLRGDLNIDWTQSSPTVYKPAADGQYGFDPFKQDEQCCLGVSPGSDPCPQKIDPNQPDKGRRCPKEDDANGIAYTECVSRVVLPIDRSKTPYEENFPEGNEARKCSAILENQGEYGKSNEIHGNFAWHTPPCRESQQLEVRFRLLIVHSFQRGLYSIYESGIFKLKSGNPNPAADKRHHPYFPSPVFNGFPHSCETPVSLAESLYNYDGNVAEQPSFEASRSYDECVRNITGVEYVNDQTCPGVPKFTLTSRSKKKRNKAPGVTASRPKNLIPNCAIIKKGSNNIKKLKCEYECPRLPVTTPEYEMTPGNRIIKRTFHGGINIVTNFCVMPICVFIARFYKETYNLQSFKGHKTWYWMHMIGSGGSTLFMYMGYFTDKLVDEADAHLVYGNLYMFCLGASYMTSWMRHKNRWISMIVESIHSVCGYGCFVLALVCVTNAKHLQEPIGNEVKYVVYVAIASLTIFYVGMTMHICSMDKRFGMKPARWHFPSVEPRFDDVPVPGRAVRKVFIFAVLFINLPLTLSTLFL